MRFVFICGSLEVGCDGVGDYTRRLAGELILQGHKVKIIALSDKAVSEIIIENQTNEFIEIAVLRIPANISNNKRFSIVKQWIDIFDPEWISLQFVPFAFHDKGLPFRLGKSFFKIYGNKKWHIMFHELWVGSHGIKSLILSTLQKRLVRNLLNQLSPQIVHTHLPIYYTELKKLNCNVRQLPLFSNVNVIPSGIEIENNIFRIAFFSQVSIEKSIIDFFNEINFEVSRKYEKIEILLIGGKNVVMNEFEEKLRKTLQFDFQCFLTGFLNQNLLSQSIQTCRLGITPVPVEALGKSSAVATFLAHGIPVAAPVSLSKSSQKKIGFFSKTLQNSIIHTPDYGNFLKAKEFVSMAKDEITITKITNKFLQDIKNYYE